MLVLTREVDQKILIGEDVTVTLVRIERAQCRIGVDAPVDVNILRSELQSKDAYREARGARPVPAGSAHRAEIERLRHALRVLSRNATRTPDGGLTIRLEAPDAERFHAASAVTAPLGKGRRS